jgi:hypothetical protein
MPFWPNFQTTLDPSERATMLTYSAETTIDAPAAAVWAILVDASAYPEFDPNCECIEGDIAEGNKIKAYTKLAPGRAFAVKVTEIVEGQKMVWVGGMPLGLFKGIRTFELEQMADGTRFRMREDFSGPMLPLIKSSLPDMNEPFAQFASGLKARAES